MFLRAPIPVLFVEEANGRPPFGVYHLWLESETTPLSLEWVSTQSGVVEANGQPPVHVFLWFPSKTTPLSRKGQMAKPLAAHFPNPEASSDDRDSAERARPLPAKQRVLQSLLEMKRSGELQLLAEVGFETDFGFSYGGWQNQW